MECADEILAGGVVDRRLAADRGVDLCEQRGRQLRAGDSSLPRRRREAGDVADDAAAEREHGAVTVDARSSEPVVNPSERVERLGRLAIGEDAFLERAAHECGAQPRQVEGRHGRVADDEQAAGGKVRFEEAPIGEESLANVDRVAARAEFDRQCQRRRCHGGDDNKNSTPGLACAFAQRRICTIA